MLGSASSAAEHMLGNVSIDDDEDDDDDDDDGDESTMVLRSFLQVFLRIFENYGAICFSKNSLVAAIFLVKKSSKLEPPSRFFGRLQIFVR